MSHTDYTPPVEDNLLGISNPEEINWIEAKGISQAEHFLYHLDTETEISISLILSLHKIAFGELYEWAGKWRTIVVKVGNIIPPQPYEVPILMYQLVDEVQFRNKKIQTTDDLLDLLAFSHHRFVEIHPFNNGNGRTARLFTDFLLLLNAYMPLDLYHREGDARQVYIQALRAADIGNLEELKALMQKGLTPF